MAYKKNFTLFAALIAACVAPALAQAAIGTGSIVTIDRSGSTYLGAANVVGDYGNKDATYGGTSTGGGEFRIIEQGVLAANAEVFKTFCLEYSEHISIPGTYNVTINDSAYFGGVGIGSTTGSPRHDKLGEITVLLYSAYRTNALDGWDLNLNSLTTDDFKYDDGGWADAMQMVIWRAENELLSDYSGLAGSVGTTLRDRADALYNYAATHLPPPGFSDPNVKVLNLWAGTAYVSGNERQSQLYYGTALIEAEVPEPASLVIWGAGLGIAGLVAARRRKMAKA